jgi:copper homeostasis protein CutC
LFESLCTHDLAHLPCTCRPAQACVTLGVDYILTSGGAATALEGAARIRSLQQRLASLDNSSASGSVAARAAAGASALRVRVPVVIAGGGIAGADSAAAVLAATGVRQLHGTARRLIAGRMQHRLDPPVYMGGEKVRQPNVCDQRD